MKTQKSYRSELERMIFDLMHSALRLADIVDQPIEGNGLIRVNYSFASGIIHTAQQCAKSAASELSWIASGMADLSEIYPQKEGGEK